MKKSLSKRLFLITLILLISLMGLTLIFQIFIFEDFYIKKKTDYLVSQMKKFQFENSFGGYNMDYVYSDLNKFQTKNNAKIGIFTLNGELKYVADNPKSTSDDEKILKDFCTQILSNKEFLANILHDNTILTKTFFANYDQSKNIGIVAPMSLKYKNDSLLVVVAPLQPILEASSVISEFYIYVFISVIFIAIILSLIYTNLITKPLVRMNNIATKMSKFDFSEQCSINRDDEIGNLANTLNFLSNNLNKAMEDLKSKNHQLEKDIERERYLEAMRKDFIASVSHELKTPVGIIKGYAEGIKDGIVQGEDASKYLDVIIDESQKMSKLISNMLELSKLESGMITPKLEVFNFNRLINKVIKSLSIECSEKYLNISFDNKTEYSYVLADIFQMDQVLTNIITNAIKYTPPNNDIIVSIDESNDIFLITVLNTGSFIPDDDIQKLFQKFYRVDSSHSRSNNSIGLGLAIVKTILDLHGSSYSIENTSEGVLFSFTLQKENIEFE